MEYYSGNGTVRYGNGNGTVRYGNGNGTVRYGNGNGAVRFRSNHLPAFTVSPIRILRNWTSSLPILLYVFFFLSSDYRPRFILSVTLSFRLYKVYSICNTNLFIIAVIW